MKSKLTKLIGATVMLLTPLVGQNFTSVQADSSVASYTAGTMSPLSGTLMASYKPGRTIRVYSEPSYSSQTQQFVPNGSNWQVFGPQNGFYNIGKNQWIPGEYSVYPIEDIGKDGYIDYVPLYGVKFCYLPNTDPVEGSHLLHSEKVFIKSKTNVNGECYYYVSKVILLDYPYCDLEVDGISTGYWVKVKYVSFSPVYTPVEGWGQISYVPGYGVRVYQSPDTSKPTNQHLKHGTKWKIIGYQEGYYQVGKNQWVRAPYVGERDVNIIRLSI